MVISCKSSNPSKKHECLQVGNIHLLLAAAKEEPKLAAIIFFHTMIEYNSIVTNCLTAMFEELIFPSGNHYHDKTGQLSLF